MSAPHPIELTKEWQKMAKQAVNEATRELNNTPRHLLNEGNPNHPKYDLHLFGEHHTEFMKRQYN